MPRHEIELRELIETVVDAILADRHHVMPARVLDYDAERMTATLRIGHTHRYPNPDGGKDLHEDLPKLYDVLVAQMRGGGYSCRLPVVAGDIVLLIVADQHLGEWRSKANADTVVQRLRDPFRNGIGGCVAIPFLSTEAGAATMSGALPAGGAYLGKEDGGSYVHLDGATATLHGSEVKLEASATDFVALASRVLAELNAIRTAFDTHSHSGVMTGMGASGPPAVPMGGASSVAASVVKAK